MIKNSIDKSKAILLSFATILCSCAEYNQDDLKKTGQGLIFDQRDTFQSRTLLIQGSNPSISSEDRQVFMQSALLSTGSAFINYTGARLYDPSHATCITKANEPIMGSSQLISPTRLVTAHHVISPSIPSRYKVTFGSSEPFNQWVADADWNDNSEEIPFLANRLFQIGLDNWAVRNSTQADVRKKLRSWITSIDLDGKDQNGKLITTQPFTAQLSSGIEHPKVKDITFLKVDELASPVEFTTTLPNGENQYTTSFYVKSGSFDIDTPGLFFNQIQALDFKNELGYLNNLPGEGKTRLISLNTPPWFDSNYNSYTPTKQTPAVCVKGYADYQGLPSIGDQNCVYPIYVCDENNKVTQIDYVDCMKTSLDIVSGSSGGSMGMSPTFYTGGVAFRDTSNKKSYGVTHGSSEHQFENSFDPSYAVSFDEKNFSVVTVGFDDYKKWGRRTTTYDNATGKINLAGDFFDPIPNQPSSDGIPPTCEMTNGFCSYSKAVSNPVWGNPETAVLGTIPKNPTEDPKDSAKYGLPTSAGRELARHLCNYNLYLGEDITVENFRSKAGVAIGFIGTSDTEFTNSDTNVASLGIICSPWSSVSWSKNWNWIYKIMRYQLDSSRDALENSTWQPLLRIALPFMIERRKNKSFEDSYVRPMSMKTCPPNYLLYGVEVNYKLKGSEKTLSGIRSLICRKDSSNEIKVHLRAVRDVSNGISLNNLYYPYKTKQFYLDQHIGSFQDFNNDGDSSRFTSTLTCMDPNKVVSGMRVPKTSIGSDINKFWLECTRAPWHKISNP